MHELHLIDGIAIALCLALAGGLAARLLRLSPIIGYLAAGFIISPFTPGYSADLESLRQLAELGVIFLMFGVGLHFTLKDLARVKGIAVTSTVIQVIVAGGAGLGVATLFGLGWREALIFGVALSICSTVVLIRGLTERRLMESIHGQVAVGRAIVEDLLTVFVLVMLPLLEPGHSGSIVEEALWTLFKAAIFLAVALVVGARLVSPLLALVGRTSSRELFILVVVSLAMAIATLAGRFGLSVAMGAFIAGVVISESETSHQAAAEVVPLREAFAVLFFVSVGMLLDPDVVFDHLGLLVAALVIVLVVKPVATMLVTSAFPYPARTGLTAAAGLATIGEFSFILADEALQGGTMSLATYNVILAVSAISIALNSFAWSTLVPFERVLKGRPPVWAFIDRQGVPPSPPPRLHNHVVIAGYGRVGELVGHALSQVNVPFVVVEADITRCRQLAAAGVPVVWGDAAAPEVRHTANIAAARLVVIAVPDQASAVLAITGSRGEGNQVPIIVRARDGADAEALTDMGANEVVVPEYEGGLEMMRQTFVALGYDSEESLHLVKAVRDTHYRRA